MRRKGQLGQRRLVKLRAMMGRLTMRVKEEVELPELVRQQMVQLQRDHILKYRTTEQLIQYASRMGWHELVDFEKKVIGFARRKSTVKNMRYLIAAVFDRETGIHPMQRTIDGETRFAWIHDETVNELYRYRKRLNISKALVNSLASEMSGML